MPKLKDVYITWDHSSVSVIPKSDGAPEHGRYFDAADWDRANLHAVYVDWFTILTVGLYDVPSHRASVVYEALCEIDEFDKIDDDLEELFIGKRAKWREHRPKLAA